jgi:hypothetical protein
VVQADGPVVLDGLRFHPAAPRWHSRLCAEARLTIEEAQLALAPSGRSSCRDTLRRDGFARYARRLMVADPSSGPAHFRLAFPLVLAGLLLGWLVGPPLAQAACPVVNPSYFDSCGPTFTLPAWGDAAGWDDPSKYSTIQLADVNGDGKDELLGRGDSGLEIWKFDTSMGQWRPQVDANAVRQVLTDFRSPLPSGDALGWKQPQYYSTIRRRISTGSRAWR